MESQDEFIMRKYEEEDIENENDKWVSLDDIGFNFNADFYIYIFL